MSGPSTNICGCENSASSLASCLPSKGTFDFSILASINQPLNDYWKLVEACKHPIHSHALVSAAIHISETIFSLCDAACASYGLFEGGVTASIDNDKISMAVCSNDDGSTSLSWKCSKIPMLLGKFALQGEEESLLARQIICGVLTNLSSLLREMGSRDKTSGSPSLCGREDGQVGRILSSILSLLGKVSSE
ncbi:hypothetical protein MGYG_03434 [Nannizzia gypsea CBS 118893]|uniref:Uncharacterized protein n=1 Tax=Arthroderma gypseum (strain ATCC MYA-4604 / CBS 118893) TaxID=535722 RepID=E4URV9_ARTGP|nr:hypothetical protein MGYG_03434 [Nannizzia gypsea CBS 118893]EFR00430.1 hypothetical protein MGYG_03434 [Nannizzia gypsea CBS 118893]